MKRLYKLFRWLNVLLILVTFIAYLSPFINPESFSWVNILGTAYPWLLFLNLLFVVFWLAVKNRYFLFSIGCILLGWNHLTRFVGMNFSTSPPSEESINIVSFNTSGFSFLANPDTSKHLKKVRDFVKFINKNGNVDILCTQEVGAYKAQLVNDKLGFKYQHKLPYKGTAILSRFPILDAGEVTFTTRANACLWADIKIRNKTIRVYSLHLKSNQVSSDADQILKEGDLQEKETWSNIKGVFGKFRYTSTIRVQQARKVQAHIQKSPHPVLLCGDFNETPQSYVYKMLSENMVDAFHEKGLGLGTTYAGSIPALRIDYILADPRIEVLDYAIFKEKHSDHYPVFSTLGL